MEGLWFDSEQGQGILSPLQNADAVYGTHWYCARDQGLFPQD